MHRRGKLGKREEPRTHYTDADHTKRAHKVFLRSACYVDMLCGENVKNLENVSHFFQYRDLEYVTAIPRDYLSSLREMEVLYHTDFVTVILCEDSYHSKICVKRLDKAVLHHCGKYQHAMNEIRASLELMTIGRTYNLGFFGVHETEEHFLLFMEYCEHRDLLQLMNKHNIWETFPEETIKEVAWQILHAVHTLHKAGVAHRNISLENIFMKHDGTIRLGDMGYAIQVADEDAYRGDHIPGKSYYRAPEVYENEKYDEFKADMFSYGIVLLALFLGDAPFQQLQANKFLSHQIRHHLATIKEENSLCRTPIRSLTPPTMKECLDLLTKILGATMPEARLSAYEALNHPLFTPYDRKRHVPTPTRTKNDNDDDVDMSERAIKRPCVDYNVYRP